MSSTSEPHKIPQALLKQERTVPAFPKRDWETCSRPYDELWEQRQTCQRCPRPQNTAGLVTAAIDLFKQSKNYPKWCDSNKSSIFSKHSACTLRGQRGSWHHHCRTRGARKKASDLLLSHLPPAAARAAHPQHKRLWAVGLLWCLPLPLHIQRLLGYLGGWSVPREAGQRRHRSTSSNSEGPSRSFTAP